MILSWPPRSPEELELINFPNPFDWDKNIRVRWQPELPVIDSMPPGDFRPGFAEKAGFAQGTTINTIYDTMKSSDDHLVGFANTLVTIKYDTFKSHLGPAKILDARLLPLAALLQDLLRLNWQSKGRNGYEPTYSNLQPDNIIPALTSALKFDAPWHWTQ